MVFATPQSHDKLCADLFALDELRERLNHSLGEMGGRLARLRRRVRASSAMSSISIEGFQVPEDAVLAVAAGHWLYDPDDPDGCALACYARAMDHVGVMSSDSGFRWVDRVILDLHFDACHFQREQSPGRWRTGPVGVTTDGRLMRFEGPSAELVPSLMLEFLDWLERGDLDAHVVVRAAMAHLHLVSIHPFCDGNGRVARIVQSLVLAREQLLAPEFGSIEEHLGRHAASYHSKLEEVQGGRYQPERDAGPWVEFCVAAHLDQTRARLRQVADARARWAHLERLVERRSWPDRLEIALEQSLFEGVERAGYGAEAGVSLATASADLRRLVDAGLVDVEGRTRNTRYVASPMLRREITL